MKIIKYDLKRLRDDLIDYFNSAINPFDADLNGIEEIDMLSSDKLLNLAKENGFNLECYEIKAIEKEVICNE